VERHSQQDQQRPCLRTAIGCRRIQRQARQNIGSVHVGCAGIFGNENVHNGGSSVSGDQEFLTEGDGVIGSPLRQPDSVRRSGPG